MSKITVYWLPLVYMDGKLVGYLGERLLIELIEFPVNMGKLREELVKLRLYYKIPRYKTLKQLNNNYNNWCGLYTSTAKNYICMPQPIYSIKI